MKLQSFVAKIYGLLIEMMFPPINNNDNGDHDVVDYDDDDVVDHHCIYIKMLAYIAFIDQRMWEYGDRCCAMHAFPFKTKRYENMASNFETNNIFILTLFRLVCAGR